MWKTGYVAIASRKGEGRGNRFASRLVTVARSCLTTILDKFPKKPKEFSIYPQPDHLPSSKKVSM
jgi:hypothetical protein